MSRVQAVQAVLTSQAVLPSSDSRVWFKSLFAVTSFLVQAKRNSDALTLLQQAIAGEPCSLHAFPC